MYLQMYLCLCDSNQRPELLQWQQTETGRQINKQNARIGKRGLLFCATFWTRLNLRFFGQGPDPWPMPDSSFSPFHATQNLTNIHGSCPFWPAVSAGVLWSFGLLVLCGRFRCQSDFNLCGHRNWKLSKLLMWSSFFGMRVNMCPLIIVIYS